MNGIALIITAIGTCITALALLFGALPLLIKALNEGRANAAEVVKIKTVSDETHKIVNQKATNQENYIAALVRTIQDGGLTVPVDQSRGNIDAAPASADLS